jgi:hypothetical protein
VTTAQRPRRRFYFEAALGVIGTALFVMTLVWQDWVETIFGFDPDHGNGSFEYLISAAFVIVAVVSWVAARAEWKRWRAAHAAGGGVGLARAPE